MAKTMANERRRKKESVRMREETWYFASIFGISFSGGLRVSSLTNNNLTVKMISPLSLLNLTWMVPLER